MISKFIVLLRWCNILSGLLSPFTSWVFWFCIVLIVFWHFFGGMMFLKRFLMSIWSVFKSAVSWRLQMYVEQQFNQSIIGSKQNQTERSQHWTVASPRFTPVNLHLPYPTISIQSYFREPHIKENDGSQHQSRSVEDCKTRTDLHFRILFVHLVPLLHHRAILSATTRLVSSLGSFIKLGKPWMISNISLYHCSKSNLHLVAPRLQGQTDYFIDGLRPGGNPSGIFDATSPLSSPPVTLQGTNQSV